MCRYATSDVQLVEVSEKDLRQDITGFIINFYGVFMTTNALFSSASLKFRAGYKAGTRSATPQR